MVVQQHAAMSISLSAYQVSDARMLSLRGRRHRETNMRLHVQGSTKQATERGVPASCGATSSLHA